MIDRGRSTILGERYGRKKKNENKSSFAIRDSSIRPKAQQLCVPVTLFFHSDLGLCSNHLEVPPSSDFAREESNSSSPLLLLSPCYLCSYSQSFPPPFLSTELFLSFGRISEQIGREERENDLTFILRPKVLRPFTSIFVSTWSPTCQGCYFERLLKGQDSQSTNLEDPISTPRRLER